MKIKKNNLSNKKLKLINYELFKTKAYRIKEHFNQLKIEDIQYSLKKSLQVIHQFHKKNKRILFVGVPTKIPKKTYNLLKTTKHITIPEFALLNGVLTNKSTTFYLKFKTKNYKKTKNLKLLFNLTKKIDLIVILNKSIPDSLLKESYSAKIPTILITPDLLLTAEKPTYTVYGNFDFLDNNIKNKFFYLLLETVLKKQYKLEKWVQKKIDLSRPLKNS